MFPDDRRFVLALAFRQACKSHFLHKAISCIDMFRAGQDMSEGSSWMISLRLWRGRRFRQKAFSRRTKSWIFIICANRIVRHDPQHDLQWFGSETRKPWTQIELFVAFDRFFLNNLQLQLTALSSRQKNVSPTKWNNLLSLGPVVNERNVRDKN